MFRNGVFILALLFTFGCGTENRDPSFDLNQLVGRWESIQDRSHRFEEWTATGDSSLTGQGYVLIGGDTTYIEFLRIEKVNGILTYFARGGDPNNTDLVAFTVSDQNEHRVEFTNPEYTFPQRIVYQIHNSNELTAFVEGPQSEGHTRIYFDFVRASDSPQN